MNIILGPVLSLRKVNVNYFHVSALIVVPKDYNEIDCSLSHGVVEQVVKIASVPFCNPIWDVIRLDFNIPLLDVPQTINYTIENNKWQFGLPAVGQSPAIAYVSCNGFSDAKKMKDVGYITDRWNDLYTTHQSRPYHILIMGGDQVYTDGLWQQVKSIFEWNVSFALDRWHKPFTKMMKEELDLFLCNIYFNAWSSSEITNAMSAIPSIMMWDDHDIFDGWGSYPTKLHNSYIYQGIFALAEQYFRVFQLQLAATSDEKHPSAIPGCTNYNLGFSSIGKISILVADLRKERQPEPMQIMSEYNWTLFYQYLNALPENGHVLLQSSIPVAYLNLNNLAKLLKVLPGRNELEDDLRDHWRDEAHRGERIRLVHNLLDFSRVHKSRVTILSGDVHVAASAVIESSRYPNSGFATRVNQLISTGVVHPAPPAIARYMLECNADRVDIIDSGITATMLPIASDGGYLIGERNWLAIEPDDKNRLWANWHVEFAKQLTTRVIHPYGDEIN
ncbi:alkaline phosphatase family protein [Klebsiella variicola]|nr:alkaline phosphatase family protein [Klebsiella variicola]